MDININLGAWNGVFAVPCDVVDKYIKLAGAAQLKVLLWLLRNAGANCTVDDMAQEFSMHPLDVKDSIQFWVDAGLLSKTADGFEPSAPSSGQVIKETEQAKKSAAKKEKQEVILQEAEPQVKEQKKPRALTRPQKPEFSYVAQRLSDSEELSFLMQEAQVILGKPLSNGDSATLLMLHEDDGLPVDVILMILQYAVGEGKPAMRYIEKIGVSWASEEIDTLEKAEEKIRAISKTKDAWGKVSRTFGLNNAGSPTKIQMECADRWVNDWKYSTDMIRLAYETCVDSKGEYNLKYIDGIIKKWHSVGICTVSDAQNASRKPKSKPDSKKREASYDIDELESLSMFHD